MDLVCCRCRLNRRITIFTTKQQTPKTLVHTRRETRNMELKTISWNMEQLTLEKCFVVR
jgi:hypothetical protein